MESDWGRYFRDQPSPPADCETNHHLLCSELDGNSARLEGDSDPLSSIWTYAEQAQVKSCNSRSFAMDARIRLESLKSGCNSPVTPRARDGTLFNYNSQDDSWDSDESEEDESEEEESALDLVELLDVEDDARDEENWLYESPKKQETAERAESALGWCRHVLDNPSPETEAACRSLINKLDQRSSCHFYRRPAVFHRTGDAAVGSTMDKTSVRTTHRVSDGRDNYGQSTNDSVTTTYRLQDITDVHIMARLQEASLRQDYVSTPAAAPPSRRGPEARLMPPSRFNTAVENTDDFTPGSQTEASSSSCWRPGLSSLTSSSCRSPTSGAKRGFQIPKLARLHQQVTQFKLLKLAQNQATSAGRTRSPLRTSLRSLQAVRNSRSLETDECHPVDSQITQPASGAPSVRKESGCWSPLLSMRDSSDRTSAVKRMQRSQSASPCRIPHPAKGYLSVRGRVFASPDRSTTVAWGRNVSSTRR